MPSVIGACFDGRLAYIYIWLSKKHRVVYVGQTNGTEGTLGRAAQHVTIRGTFRQRFEEVVGLQLEAIDDLILLSFPLPFEPEFTGIESSFREGVEFLVQQGLLDARSNLTPMYRVISTVRPTAQASLKRVQTCADDIVKQFVVAYATLTPLPPIY
ncbi:hypothetical protein GQ464_010775 [Rhodocaloribacter litoris]|uniref:hypothetical protein n=1 Tax=Rhodocaloribacter litoris TaxID=2558931 RepID=UPI00141EC3C7|nr:hypothetical protein [Rhodocaloribacter litoris]QXD13941.1 hypothetical protein GQ464_010775 [Rhodocaloribacter litoris]